MTQKNSKIIWTKVDEAPALATYSLLPMVNLFVKSANIIVDISDISLTGRILANFPDNLTENQKVNDELANLGELVNEPVNIIKLPNISASIPQLKEAIHELQSKGYNIPDYPEEPKTDKEIAIQKRYAKVLGSAVNPVLRQGNSDRRVAASVKKFAQQNPHKLMRQWEPNNKTHVAHMNNGDFYANEKSVIIDREQDVRIEFVNERGEITVFKDKLHLLKDEIIDGTFLSVKALRNFIEKQVKDAKEQGVLFSVHLKATMMKVSDPVIFGHFVSVFYKELFEKYADTFKEIGVNPELGLADLYKKLNKLPESKKDEILNFIGTLNLEKPGLAMVDSDKGISNLHVGNLVIIDASMPVVIRDGGRMWNTEGKLQDVKAIIPDRSYATFYQEAISFCQENGAFNPATMGSVSNVGLMAQKAEEYGSHDKTFIARENGTFRIVNEDGKTIIEHIVEKGDIWRGCQAKDIPIRDWVKLAVSRARISGDPAVFWLDKNRCHDSQMIRKVEKYLKDHDTTGLEIHIMSPVDAMKYTLPRVKEGKNTISVTGNALRDYLTDLFPILEIGTSARMLSIVPLLAGGGLFETGAGGSAPKHVRQFLDEGHLRWDSLGEYLALQASLEYIGQKSNDFKVNVLADTLDKAIEKFLANGKSPSRKAGELDNRGSHFFLVQYWAEAVANQTDNKELQEKFASIAKYLIENENKILKEIANAEGKPTDIGGYYLPNNSLVEKAMRPSETLNAIIGQSVLA